MSSAPASPIQDPFLSPVYAETLMATQLAGEEEVAALNPGIVAPSSPRRLNPYSKAPLSIPEQDYGVGPHPVGHVLESMMIHDAGHSSQRDNRRERPEKKKVKWRRDTPSPPPLFPKIGNFTPSEAPASKFVMARTPSGIHRVYQMVDYGGYSENRWGSIYGQINAAA